MYLLYENWFSISILLTVVSSAAASGTKCAAVEFPTLDASLTLTVVENDTIRLPFTVVNASCGGQKKTFVTVKAFTRTSPDPTFLCLLILQNGQCLKEDGCTCDGKDKFILGRKTARSEIGRWVWESSIMATRQIFANITYPAEVRELKLVPSSPVEEYSQLNISCTWEKGNPPVQAQLTHSLKLSLADQTPNDLIPIMTTPNEDNSTTVTHIFNSVYCKDVGFIRCLAPGASSNKTATLLVKCPPSFTDETNQTFRATDDRVNLTFTIRTLTREVEGCTLTHLTSGGASGKTRDCLRSHSVFGTPPDLVLTVLLDNVTSEDDGGWRLIVSNDAGQGHVDFRITGPEAPARVTSLSLSVGNNTVTYQNTTVDIVCTWNEGNPPVTARLLDRHGVEMEGSNYSSGQIRYRFPAVGCQDAGLIRCEAPGASRNMTVTLLVKCKPTFAQPERNEITVESGSDMVGKFPLRTHTTDFTECLLSKYASNAYDRKGFSNRAQTVGECDSFVNLTGTPPDLVLTVRLDNVRKQDEGHWTVDLTNDAGTGRLEFVLVVTEGLWKVITAVGVSVLVLLIIIVTIFCTRKGRKRAVIPQPAVELAVIQRRSLVREEDGSAPSVHIYWDADPPAADGEDVAEEAPPPICHRPGNPPADYLNPEPSRDETQDEGAEFNTVPFYHNTQIRNVGATSASDGDSQTAAPRKWMSSHPEDGIKASDDNPDSDGANTESRDVTDYVGYDPRLYENSQL